ncbi:ATP-binding protein [Patescibacteria group bacterium]|nr:ATP-binding protein [Patescibacteria group bacterium]MBU1683033.1 ATP-binding protein [Patescibacteria group bacterium]
MAEAATVTQPQVSTTHPEEHSVLNKSNAVKGEATPVKISITLPTNAYFMSGIRDFTMTVVQNMTGFSEKWAYRFQSVVDELTNNAIEFGSAPGEDIKVTFVSMEGKYIEVFVEDTGTGANKKTAAEMTAFVDDHRNIDPTTITTIRGRGLTQIVVSWTDTLEFQDNEKGGLTVHVVKNLDAGEEGV